MTWFTKALNPKAQQQDINEQLQAIEADGIHLRLPELLKMQRFTHLLNLKPKHAIQTKLAGNYLAKSKGRGMEFDEVRHYQPGDDIRAIDWRVTARTGETYTKLFREEKERPVFILTDLSRNMQFGSQYVFKSIQAAHLAALIAWSAREKGDRLGGVVLNSQQHHELKPRSRQHGVLQYLHALQELQNQAIENIGEAEDSNAFSEACGRLRRIARPGCTVYVLSDFANLDENAQHHLAQLSRQSELITIHISDPFESDFPQLGFSQQLAVSDGVNNGSLSQRHHQDWHNAAEQQQAQINKALVRCRARQFSISAAQSLQQQLTGRL